MSWKDRIKSVFSGAPEKKYSAAAPMMVQFGGHTPRFTPRQYDRLAEEGYKKNVIAYRCIKLISQNAAAVPWAVRKKSGGKDILRDHPLLDLLQRPNPMQGGAEFFEAAFGFFLISGNSYIEAVGPSFPSAPRELWALRPDRMRVMPGDNGVPVAYRYTVGGSTHDYPRSRILHVKSFNPLDDWYGMSPLEAAAISVDQHNDAARWNASLLQRSGRPSGALIYKPTYPESSNTLTDEQRQALKNELKNYFSGAENAGRPLVLEGGLDWKEMSLSPHDMDWLAGKDVSAREIALAFHVPAQLIGIQGSLTFSNFEQARLALFDDAVLPLLDHMKDELNNWLAPQFGDGIEIDYNIDKIEALAPRRQQIWDRITHADFMTINEKREAFGLEAIEGGDVLGNTLEAQPEEEHEEEPETVTQIMTGEENATL